MNEEQEPHSGQEQEAPPPPAKKNPFSGLIPREGYLITPIIIDLNIAVWLLMVVFGVSPVTPDTNALLDWGANLRSLSMNGEPWRMFTCMFLHYGIIHLAVNMWAFQSIGKMLEPFIGKWRFLVLYLCSGLGASAVSMWWHDNSVAVGASGAIFGTFGIFAALLTTDLINKAIRWQMLKSVGFAIALNLFIGLSWHIDNSAHIGGLITGAIGGYLIYFDLKLFYYKRIKRNIFLWLATLITAAGIFTFWKLTPKGNDFNTLEDRFIKEETKAMQFYGRISLTKSADSVRIKYVEPFQRCVLIADTMEDLENINDIGKKLSHLYGKYAEMRLNAGDIIYRHAWEHRFDLVDSANVFTRKADSLRIGINQFIEINSK